MKNILSTAFISISLLTNVNSAELTKEQYKDLMLSNRASYESVLPGMNYVGVGVNTVITDEQGNETKCRQAIESTVIQVYGTRYLTHEKVKHLNDCDPFKEGQLEEYLQWNEIYDVEKHFELLENRVEVTSIHQKDSIIEIKGTTKSSIDEPRKFSKLFNFKETQFFNIKSYNDGLFNWTQFYTRQIDQTQINISDLEVREIFE